MSRLFSIAIRLVWLRRGDRLNQDQVIVLDVADPRTHQQTTSSAGQGASKAFKRGKSAASSPSYSGQT